MTNLIDAPHGTTHNGIFYFPVRIYYEDTDAGGIVYYANYLKFAERARTEFLRTITQTAPHQALTEDQCGFVVKKLDIDYKSSAVLDDLLAVSCEVVNIKGPAVEMRQEVRRGEDVLAQIHITVVYVSLLKKRPVRLPSELIAALLPQ
jgi:acyl-CoA thioester hydrolase